MALLGEGVAAIWHNVSEEIEEDYNLWHGQEHVPERVGIEGFLRGRRYVAQKGQPKYFHFYETEALDTLTSAPYLERLNDPTPWTARIGPHIRDNIRTLSRVHTSNGAGVGALMITVRISVADRKRQEVADGLATDWIPQLSRFPGTIGVHLLTGDKAASETPSKEKTLRGVADDAADLVLLIDGPEPAWCDALMAEYLTPNRVAALGADATAIGTYQLLMVLDAQELVSPDTRA